MPQLSQFHRLDRLFTSRIQESIYVKRWGSHEVRSIELIGGIKLQCAMDEERTYWYEVVFPEGDQIHVDPGGPISAGDALTPGYVLNENDA